MAWLVKQAKTASTRWTAWKRPSGQTVPWKVKARPVIRYLWSIGGGSFRYRRKCRMFFFSSRRRHTRCSRDWSSDVCSSDLVRLAGADCFHGLPALELVGVVEAAVPEHLRDMPAKLRVERLADLVVLQTGDRLLELRGEGSRPRPTQVTALGGGSRVLGSGLGEAGEVLALENPLAQRREL